MRGNTISSKQNCFLGEAPRQKCEGDSRKGKNGEISSKKEREMIKNCHSIIRQYLASFLLIFFIFASKNYLLYKVLWQAIFIFYQYKDSSF